MATISNGNTAEIYAAADSSITLTPGSGGVIEFDCSSPSGSVRPVARKVYASETISIPGGSTVFARAVGADAAYSLSSVSGGVKAWRGIGQNMRLDVQGFASGVNTWSRTTRSRHYSNVRFKRVRAVIQCFQQTGTPIADTLFENSMNFQVAFEAAYANATTGISAGRPMFHFSGSPVGQYISGSPPSNGYLISDVLDLPEYVEAGQFFGLWTTQEIAARAGTDVLPWTKSASNFLQRYTGYVAAANVSRIDADTARNATSVTAHTSTQTGEVNWFTPCMLLIETDSAAPFVVAIGDSITYGVGEGHAGSGAFGDSIGSQLGNSGIVERSLYENLEYNAVNMGKGGDRNEYLATASNWQYRRALLALANPTHVINANIHNDLTPAIGVTGWAPATPYAKYDVTSSVGGDWMALTAGTSGATPPSGTGAAFWDGGVMWAYIIPHPAASTARAAAINLAKMASANTQIKEAVPNAKILAMLPTPDASSSDNWATAGNQTVTVNYGNSLSRRGYVIGNIMANWGPLQLSGYFDPNQYVEDSWPTQTSKWVSNGVARLATYDGTHPNSSGYNLAIPALTAAMFA